MKICDMTQSFSPSGGGVRTYLMEKRKFIARNPALSHVLIVPGERDSVAREGNLTCYTIAAGQIPRCAPYRFTFRLDKVISILKAECPDVIELGSAYVLPYAGFLVRRRFGCAIVGFYHTDFPAAYVENGIKPVTGDTVAKGARRMAENYARYLYNRCDATITSAARHEERLDAMGVHGVRRIALGVDLETFHPNRRDMAFREALGVKARQPLFVYAGRFDHEKRVLMILEAFLQAAEGTEHHLLLMGEGVLKPQVMARAAANRRIHVCDFQPSRTELARALASSDCYLTASPHETFGLSIIEAQACGLPVIGVKGGALIERVPEAVGALGRVDSVEEMAAHMANGAAWRCGKGRAARQWVAQQFSWDRTFEQLFTLYDETRARGYSQVV